MVAKWTQVRRTGLAPAAVLVLAAACGGSGNGDGSAASRSSSSTAASAAATTTTTAVTTTTLSAEEQVKAAYLKYWEVVDQVLADPASGPARLSEVAADPLLGFVTDDVDTRAALGHTVTTPPGRTTSHRIDQVTVSGTTASVVDCFIDARVEFDAAGVVVDDALVSKLSDSKLELRNNRWVVTDSVVRERALGPDRCAA